MSYILDALNKSEQERRSRTTPDLSSIHRKPPSKPSSNRWLPTLVVLAAVNTVGLWLFWVNQDPTTIQIEDLAVSSVKTPSAANPVAQTQKRQLLPSETRTSEMPNNQVPLIENSETQYPVSRGGIAEERESLGLLITPTGTSQIYTESQPVNISELPRSVQRQIPDLQFSSHLFSDDRSFRMVNINGSMLREGEYINDELRLEEITTDGVILNYQQHTFEISILRDWKYN